MQSSSFDYELPEEAIAIHPVEPRSIARMLVWRGGVVEMDYTFKDLPNLLPSDSQLWVNNTKVIRARLILQKPTGGRLEVFLLEPMNLTMEQALSSTQPVDWKCLVKGGKRWNDGTAFIEVEGSGGIWSVQAKRIGADEGVRFVQLSWTFRDNKSEKRSVLCFSELLDVLGKMPLPPYMRRQEEAQDAVDYQTIYAEVPGSVAAPTAGLHFDSELFAELSVGCTIHNVTLHVGAGTFKPLVDGSITDHSMHGESCLVSNDAIQSLCKMGVHRVATGTTSLRTLESLYWLAIKWKTSGTQPHELNQWEWRDELNEGARSLNWNMETAMQWCAVQLDGRDWHFHTSIMIIPGYEIRSVQALITNFHLPNSTLLCLVAAAIGDSWKSMYEEALDSGFRFLSFGDGSYLEWNSKG